MTLQCNRLLFIGVFISEILDDGRNHPIFVFWLISDQYQCHIGTALLLWFQV